MITITNECDIRGLLASLIGATSKERWERCQIIADWYEERDMPVYARLYRASAWTIGADRPRLYVPQWNWQWVVRHQDAPLCFVIKVAPITLTYLVRGEHRLVGYRYPQFQLDPYVYLPQFRVIRDFRSFLFEQHSDISVDSFEQAHGPWLLAELDWFNQRLLLSETKTRPQVVRADAIRPPAGIMDRDRRKS